ncbi:MAG: glycosyltransferase family 2 protein [Candidatus Hydrogenedentes bacterium]|nr:glycosyltransferase family 2 protein [Candidatus Hydrogenedentota bacterium]
MSYPVVQSIRSILPLVDEFVVGVGQSEDNTRELLQSIADPKIHLFDSFWDTSKTSGGLILSEKTNEALSRCEGDWCFYLQADEVVHELDLAAIRKSMEDHLDNPEVEGLLLRFVHFYGSFSVVATARNWYRNEVRVIKRSSGARSVRDAQGFRIGGARPPRLLHAGERKPRVVASGASIFHYGWVKPPQLMGRKNQCAYQLGYGKAGDDNVDDFRYRACYGLKRFTGAHPAVMRELVDNQDWIFEPHSIVSQWDSRDVKNVLSDIVEKATGYRVGEHKNYVLLKRP